jgi:FKBP-type peptidyl-prolyl cis-trans isomerase FkpA
VCRASIGHGRGLQAGAFRMPRPVCAPCPKRGSSVAHPVIHPDIAVKPIAALLLALAAVPAVAQSPAPSAPSDLAARAAKEPGATVLPSGVVFRPTAQGKGASPAATDTVRVHYRGVLADGKEFDSSIKRGQPAEFPLNRVIKCWTEGVQLMKAGGKATLTCPPGVAYGERGAAGVIPPNATLQFEIELLGIVR